MRLLFLATVFAILVPSLDAQCGGCCKEKPAAKQAGESAKAKSDTGCCQDAAKAKAKAGCCSESTAKAEAKPTSRKTAKLLPSLFNATCPVTGLPTSEATPTVDHAGYRVSLCCSACAPRFAQLDKAKQSAFLAMHTGKFRKSAFPKRVAKTGKDQPAKTDLPACCQEQAKTATEAKDCTGACGSSCDAPEKPTVKPAVKPAGKVETKVKQ